MSLATKLKVEKVNHECTPVRERLFGFLAPHEAYCLFITGNLKNNFPDSHVYVASRGTKWVGVAGYYGGPKSLIPFSAEAEAVRALVRRVAENHPDIDYLNAVAAVAEPACEELHQFDYEVSGNPRQVFMQLEGDPPAQPHEELVRAITPADHEAVARLLRYLRSQPQEPPVSDEERRKVSRDPFRHVLVVDDQVASTASTNGVGISAFQILGVATQQEHRGKGYARAVCASLIRTMRKDGAHQAIIFTDQRNMVARRCYEGLGFHTTDEYWVARLRRVSPGR